MDEHILVGGVAWLVLQALALWRLDGWWRKAAWVSAVCMTLAIAVAVLGVLAGSNLAPIWVVLALPVCLTWIVMLWIVRGAARFIRR